MKIFKSAIEKHTDSEIEEQIFEQVADEMNSGEIRSGLWTKAFSESNGDPDRTKARYILLRANSIVKEKAAQNQLLVQASKQPHTSKSIPPSDMSNTATIQQPTEKPTPLSGAMEFVILIVVMVMFLITAYLFEMIT